jgi:uncharacterized membrane protein
VVLVYLDRIRQWDWQPAAISGALLLPVLFLVAAYSWIDNGHLLVYPDAMFWLLAFAANYWVIVQLEGCVWPRRLLIALHVGFLILLALAVSGELMWYFDKWLPGTGQGYAAIVTIMPLLFMYWSRRKVFPAIHRLGNDLQLSVSIAMMLLMLLWSVWNNLQNNANPAPLPYIPLLNPLDLAHIVLFISIIRSLPLIPEKLMHIRNPLLVITGGLAFLWVSALLMRSMHHYADIPFDPDVMLHNVKIHTALSILWTIIGMLAMLVAARRALRPLWIAGACLVVVVLVKMFFIDLGANGTVERIVSFLVVGGLLVAMGYFSPIPPRTQQKEATHAMD